jgi:putative MATE family efflux protein
VDDHRLTAPPDLDAALDGVPEAADGPVPPPAPVPALVDGRRPAWRLVLTLAWPSLAQQLLVLAVTLSDRLLVGRFQHLEAGRQLASQAAQTTAYYLSWFISSYTVLVSVGSTALVARFVGAGDRKAAVHVTNQSLLLAALLGLLGSAAGLAGLPLLVRALQLHGEAAAFAAAYLQPLFLLLVFQVVESAGVACLAGAGDMRTGLWVLGGVAVVNVPLAWGFFRGVGPWEGLGFRGIAVGTGVSHLLGALAVVGVLARGRFGLRLRPRLLRPDADLLRRLLRVSVPAAADSLSVAAGQLWFVSIVNGLSDAASGAHGIALGWEALGYLSGMAFGTAAMTLVGQNLGAGRPDRAARAGWTTFAMGGALMTLMGVVFFALAPQMFRLFCPDPAQEPIIKEGVPVLRLVAFAMPALASCIIFTAALRGAGDTRVPVLFTWLGFFAVRIPLAYVLVRPYLDLGPLGVWPGAGRGLFGAWLAMFADILVRGLFFLARFAGGRWRTMRV